MESKRAKTARGRRILSKRESKILENPRSTLVARGQKSSALVNELLTDLFRLKQPHSVHLRRHNAVHPWEDASPLEFLCQKNDASLFAFGTHSKKRPHNLVLGRMFDHKMLDMWEFGVDASTPMAAFAKGGIGPSAESKPLLLFQGEAWEHVPQLAQLKTFLIDFFHGEVLSAISPLGVERVLAFTAAPTGWEAGAIAVACGGQKRVHMRQYACVLKKSVEGTSPFVELVEMGPTADLNVRRVQSAAPDLMREALRKPAASSGKPKAVKNVTHSRLGGREGRLHVPKQDLSQMPTARMKGLGKRKGSEFRAKNAADKVTGATASAAAGGGEAGGASSAGGGERPPKKARRAAGGEVE